MVALTANSSHISLFLTAIPLVGSLLAWWAIAAPRFPLLFLALSLSIGQAARLPLPGQGGGLLVSDLATILVLLAAITSLYRHPNPRPPQLFTITTPIILFLLWTSISTLLGIWRLNLSEAEILISLSYYLRLATNLLLIPAFLVFFSRSSQKHLNAKTLFVITTTLLILFGFLQFLFLSNFSSLAPAGWDPHHWRLTSTWLDPNFFAAFLLVSLPIAITFLPRRTHAIILGLAGILALLVTKSRSGLLAASLALAITTPMLLAKTSLSKTAKLLAPLAATFSLTILVITSLIIAPRALALLYDDPTANLRTQAFKAITTQLLPKWGLAGTGYNTYQFAASNAGLITDFTQHSRAGTDNSYLTIWVTTGIPGLLLFLTIWIVIASSLFKSWWHHHNYHALAALFGVIALTIHAQIVNSLLYSHLLITIAWAIALALTAPLTTHQPKTL